MGSGPQLVLGAGEAALVDSLNDWCRRVDASLGLMSGAFSDLRTEVAGTQTVLVATIQEAKIALGAMHEGFRTALDAHARGYPARRHRGLFRRLPAPSSWS